MAFVIENSEYWAELTTMFYEAILSPHQLVSKKVAKIYLLSDILYNSSAPVPNASMFRVAFQPKLEGIFENLNETLKGIQGRITAEHMKEQILRVLRVWNSWSLYPPALITQLTALFLKGQKPEKPREEPATKEPSQKQGFVDIHPEKEEDIDGVPLDEALSTEQTGTSNKTEIEIEEDIDGVPLEDIDGLPLDNDVLQSLLNNHK